MATTLLKGLTLGLALVPFGRSSHIPLTVQKPSDITLDDVKVPVVLGVMSRCPDALLCESVFDYVIKKVPDKIDLSLTYVGTLNASEPDFGVTCKHGRTECVGNVQQLCAAKYAESLSQWWTFVQCQNFEGKDKVGDPALALRCANVAHIDWVDGGAGGCAGLDASGTAPEGVRLLKESVEVTRGMAIVKSCTIVINEKHVCIRDETWKECEEGHSPNDFIRQINNEYRKLNSDSYDSEYDD